MGILSVIVTAVLLALAAIPSSLNAAPLIGVGDNSPGMFADPHYKSLNMKISRKIIPWDYYKSAVELNNLDRWIENAASAGVDPMIALERSYSEPTKLPSNAEYLHAMRTLVMRYPTVRTLTTWNEANHGSQPTAHSPRRVAQYYKLSRVACPDCKIIAADLLDDGSLFYWARKIKHYTRGQKIIWGLHNYGDVNNFRRWNASMTRAFLKRTKGEVWLTETGGIVALGDWRPYDEARAATATKLTFRYLKQSKRFTRLYLYCWYGNDPNTVRWDSGFVRLNGSPRPSFFVLRSHLRK